MNNQILQKQKGFSLPSVLVGSILVAVLGTVAVSSMWGAVDNAKVVSEKNKLKDLENCFISASQEKIIRAFTDSNYQLIESCLLNTNSSSGLNYYYVIANDNNLSNSYLNDFIGVLVDTDFSNTEYRNNFLFISEKLKDSFTNRNLKVNNECTNSDNCYYFYRFYDNFITSRENLDLISNIYLSPDLLNDSTKLVTDSDLLLNEIAKRKIN